AVSRTLPARSPCPHQRAASDGGHQAAEVSNTNGDESVDAVELGHLPQVRGVQVFNEFKRRLVVRKSEIAGRPETPSNTQSRLRGQHQLDQAQSIAAAPARTHVTMPSQFPHHRQTNRKRASGARAAKDERASGGRFSPCCVQALCVLTSGDQVTPSQTTTHGLSGGPPFS
ncbi:hypothetical protein BaRGS_00012368, partial [Batillaria attramentaria]